MAKNLARLARRVDSGALALMRHPVTAAIDSLLAMPVRAESHLCTDLLCY